MGATTNRLFLFAPSRQWNHCGGATLIAAESVEEAISIGNAAQEHIAERGAFYADEASIDDYQSWVLVDTFLLAEVRPRGVVFSGGNHA